MNGESGCKEISRLKEENLRLRRALEELSILNEIAVAINSAQSLDLVLESIVKKCTKHLKVEQVAVWLLDEKEAQKPFQTMVRGWDTPVRGLPYRLDTQLTGWMLKNRVPLLINDFRNDNRFKTFSEDTLFIPSLLSVPLMSKDKMIGLITVFNKKMDDKDFDKDDQRLLSIIASQSAQVIENARLLEEEQELIKVQQDLRLANDIQVNLLPDKPPVIDGYDFYGKSIPAKAVGGDYFDFIPIDEHRIAFCVGDISGKGIPAALLMCNLQAAVRGQTMTNAGVSECVEHINTMLVHNTPAEKFSTFFYGVLDTRTHQITYANAGHNFPFLFSEGREPRQLQEADMILGIMESIPYTEQHIVFNPGDILVLYSDGITEAMDCTHEEFGEKCLAEAVEQYRGQPVNQLGEGVIEAVQQHAGECRQYDDMTLVIIKRGKS